MARRVIKKLTPLKKKPKIFYVAQSNQKKNYLEKIKFLTLHRKEKKAKEELGFKK